MSNATPQPRPCLLYVAHHRPIDLDTAVRALSDKVGTRPVALFYTPRRCLLAAREGGAWRGTRGAIDATEAYEARVFGESAELRWWFDPDEQAGRAAVLSEATLAPCGWKVALEGKSVQCAEQRYLPWGTQVEGAPVARGWQRRTSARIGSLDLPTPIEDVQLLAREYLDLDEQHGNSFVLEERLVGFVEAEK